MPENDQTIVDRVIKTVIATTAASRAVDAEIDASTLLDDPPLSMDSLDHVSLMVNLEDEFGIIASDEDFAKESVSTVGDIAVVVQRLLS